MNADTRGIGELIQANRLFAVPDHQRDYAWDADDEVLQFIEDLEREMLEGRSDDYFLGLIVLVHPEDGQPWEILDGQQRLATTTMIYAAIRDWLSANRRDVDAQVIQNDYIGIRTLGEP